MATEVTLQDVELADFASNAELSGQEIATHMASLMSQLEPLITDWQGAAGKQFTAIREVMQIRLTNITDALNDVAVMTRTSGQIFNASDDIAAGQVSSIMQQMSV